MSSGKALFVRVGVVSLVILGQTAARTTAQTATTPDGAQTTATLMTGAGLIRGFNGVQELESTCTSSEPFEEMAGMSLLLRTRGPLVAMFQGQFGAFETTAGARVVINIEVDGEILGSARAIGADVGTQLVTFGFNAFSRPLAPGPHRVKVTWHTFPAGARVCVEERSLIVLHL
jgi:hypothetical protein